MARLYRLLFLAGFLLLTAAVGLAALRFPALVMLAVAWRLWSGRRRWSGSGDSHGTARALTVPEMVRLGMFPGDDGKSLIMGTADYADPPTLLQAFGLLINPFVGSAEACRVTHAAVRRRSRGGIVRIRDYVHLLTCAPAGAGKSVAVLLVNLLSYRGSCVVADPKGELYKYTAWFREHVLGHTIVRIDPAGVGGPVETADCLNSFDFIDPHGRDFAEMVRDVGDSIVIRDDEKTPHWNDRAVDVLTAITAFVCACARDPAKRHLGTVRDLLSNHDRFSEAIEAMQLVEGFGGVVANYGGQLTFLQDKERASVLSTVHRQISWMMSPAITACLSRSTFDPRRLWSGKMTIYIILPHDRLSILAGVQRLIISTIMRLIARNGDESHPVLFMLDEAGHLGKLRIVEDAVTLLRSFGIRVWLFVQSIDQLKKIYGERASTVLDNLGTQQYFGITSYDTAEAMSRRVGDCTIVVESINRNASYSHPVGQRGGDPTPGSYTTGTGTTLSEAARRWIKPEEILVLPRDAMLLFHRNLPVIPLRLYKHFRVKDWMTKGVGRERGPGLSSGVLAFLLVVAGYVAVALAASFQPPTLQPPDRPAWQVNEPQAYPYSPYRFDPQPSGGMGSPLYRLQPSPYDNPYPRRTRRSRYSNYP